MTHPDTHQNPAPSGATPGRGRKLVNNAEGFVQAAIMAFIGLMAGRASFTHMHDWTMEASPAHTPGWFGWSNAVVSELIPVTALLDIRRKRRAGKSFGEMKFPIAVLVISAGLSLAAQISQASNTAAGWLVAALPALGFLVVAKLVFSGHNKTTDQTSPVADPATTPETADASDPLPDTTARAIADPATVTRPATEPTDTDTPVFAPWAPPAARLNGTRPSEVNA